MGMIKKFKDWVQNPSDDHWSHMNTDQLHDDYPWTHLVATSHERYKKSIKHAKQQFGGDVHALLGPGFHDFAQFLDRDPQHMYQHELLLVQHGYQRVSPAQLFELLSGAGYIPDSAQDPVYYKQSTSGDMIVLHVLLMGFGEWSPAMVQTELLSRQDIATHHRRWVGREELLQDLGRRARKHPVHQDLLTQSHGPFPSWVDKLKHVDQLLRQASASDPTDTPDL